MPETMNIFFFTAQIKYATTHTHTKNFLSPLFPTKCVAEGGKKIPSLQRRKT